MRCFIRAERGSRALAVAAMLARGLGKITLLEELGGVRGRLEAALSRLLWPNVRGLLELLDGAELLLLLLAPAPLAPLLMESEDEQGGRREDATLPLDGR